MPDAVKLSSPATNEFWEVPVLFEDDHLLVLNKPAGLLVSPDGDNPKRPSLMELLHRGIERGASWAAQRKLGYLMNGHHLDFGVSGVMVLVKNKAALIALAAQFTTEEPRRFYAALVRGTTSADTFATDVKLAPHPLQMGVIRVDLKEGKRSRTDFTVRERFNTCSLIECRPTPDRPDQVRVHLKHLRLPVVGDNVYGGRPLLLSKLKPGYELKKDEVERPLIDRPALHVERVVIAHPATGSELAVESPWPKDFNASVKYLRRYSAGGGGAPEA